MTPAEHYAAEEAANNREEARIRSLERDLSPCPRCGKSARILTDSDDCYFAQCPRSPWFLKGCGFRLAIAPDFLAFETAEHAVSAWNEFATAFPKFDAGLTQSTRRIVRLIHKFTAA